MKYLFTMHDLTAVAERATEGIEVLLQGQPFSDQVKVYIEVGVLARSEELANKIGAYVHGRRWGKIIRNDGHYIEVEVEEQEGEKNAPSNPRS